MTRHDEPNENFVVPFSERTHEERKEPKTKESTNEPVHERTNEPTHLLLCQPALRVYNPKNHQELALNQDPTDNEYRPKI